MYLTEEAKWGAEIKKWKDNTTQEEKLKKVVSDLGLQTLTCQIPSRVYPIYLLECWVTFQLKKIAARQPNVIS